MNTQIEYLYRDADNYKNWNHVIVTGTLTDAQIEEIISCCDCNEYFIPSQVGLPEERFEKWDEDADHCWFSLEADSFSQTPLPATVDITARQLYENFLVRKGNWDDTAPVSFVPCEKNLNFTIVRDGITYTLSAEELYAAYRVQAEAYHLEDALMHLANHYDIRLDRKKEEQMDAFASFQTAFGFSFEEAVCDTSEHYLLSVLSERFQKYQSEELSNEDVWDTLIEKCEAEYGVKAN